MFPRFLFLLPLVWTSTAQADDSAPQLSIPIQCEIGRDCFIQNYADADPSSDYRDYTCGRLTYNAHTGTDFRLRNLRQMNQGVAVLAAASGTVKAVRDGMRDQNIREGGKSAIRDRECGNGVVIAHSGGWETQYCHMRNASLTVRVGQAVKTGDKLGLVGLSGETEFPHLHLTLRHGPTVIDPFTGNVVPSNLRLFGGNCIASTMQNSLWSEAAKPSLSYIPTALIGIGFSTVAPDAKTASEGGYEQATLPASIKLLAFWVELIGLQPGDQLSLQLLSPKGDILAAQRKEIPSSKAQLFSFIGKRFSAPLPPGIYIGRLTLQRGPAAPIQQTLTVTVK